MCRVGGDLGLEWSFETTQLRIFRQRQLTFGVSKKKSMMSKSTNGGGCNHDDSARELVRIEIKLIH